MAVLVTGGAGYIGGHMVLGLLDAGEQPVVIDNMINGVSWAVPKNVPFVQGDIGDYDVLAQIFRTYDIDAIAHFAARLITPDLYDDPLEYYQANAAKTRNLLAAARDYRIKHFIFSATAAVYGNPVVNPVPETAALAPISAYGASKLVGEYMLRDLAAVCDMRYAALRYFNVAGADPLTRYGQSTTKSTLLVQIAVQAALGLRPYVELFGTDYPTVDGTCVRDYIHVTDLVDAHLAALRYLREGGDNLTLNCGYGRGYSVKQVLETAKQVSGRDFQVRIGPRRRGDAVEVVAEAKEIRQRLAWSPQYDHLPTILEHALRWEAHLHAHRRFDNRA